MATASLCFRHLLLLATTFLHLSATATAIGVNYGTTANDLPPPSQVANFIKTQTTIDSIKIFDINQDIIRAFANTGISVTVTIPNGDILSLTQIRVARRWVNNNIAPFYPQTKIRYICVGSEILHWADNNTIMNLVPAMKILHHALVLAGLNDIKVTSPNSLGILEMPIPPIPPTPPSKGQFRSGYINVLAPMLNFLRQTKSPFMFNPYPYFGYSPEQANYTLFRPNPGFHDNYTGITYTNMFEALIDTTYSAMKAIGYGDVDVVLGETGWPSLGEPFLTQCTVENAAQFNGNVFKFVSSGKGTPLMPNRMFETYIFALFNENLKPGSIAERNFGLFRPDFSPVYDIGIMRNGEPTPTPGPALALPLAPGPAPTPAPSQSPPLAPIPAPPPVTSKNDVLCGHGRHLVMPSCVPKLEANKQALKANIDHMCSQGVVCKPIQAGGPCLDPNNVKSQAAYVMDTYYQTHGPNGFNHHFSHAGVLITSDPSTAYGACKYMA